MDGAPRRWGCPVTLAVHRGLANSLPASEIVSFLAFGTNGFVLPYLPAAESSGLLCPSKGCCFLACTTRPIPSVNSPWRMSPAAANLTQGNSILLTFGVVFLETSFTFFPPPLHKKIRNRPRNTGQALHVLEAQQLGCFKLKHTTHTHTHPCLVERKRPSSRGSQTEPP